MKTDHPQTIYTAIAAFIRQHGYAPSLREIRDGTGLSIPTIQLYLVLLQERGLIQHTPGIARSIVLLEPQS
jgi:repressor LexA